VRTRPSQFQTTTRERRRDPESSQPSKLALRSQRKKPPAASFPEPSLLEGDASPTKDTARKSRDLRVARLVRVRVSPRQRSSGLGFQKGEYRIKQGPPRPSFKSQVNRSRSGFTTTITSTSNTKQPTTDTRTRNENKTSKAHGDLEPRRRDLESLLDPPRPTNRASAIARLSLKALHNGR
jgi:hypothetical protein